jgi:hypothetical protein
MGAQPSGADHVGDSSNDIAVSISEAFLRKVDSQCAAIYGHAERRLHRPDRRPHGRIRASRFSLHLINWKNIIQYPSVNSVQQGYTVRPATFGIMATLEL